MFWGRILRPLFVENLIIPLKNIDLCTNIPLKNIDLGINIPLKNIDYGKYLLDFMGKIWYIIYGW